MPSVRTNIFYHLPLPRMAKVAAVQVLCKVFADAFDVEAPCVFRTKPPAPAAADLPTADPIRYTRPDLWAFRSFSAACMDAALTSQSYTRTCQARLYEGAYTLGGRIRALLCPRPADLPQLVSLLYSLIEIDVEVSANACFIFKRCYFSGGYIPQLCQFMSAFDSGFVGGLYDGGALQFSTRITEGAPCCHACLIPKEGML